VDVIKPYIIVIDYIVFFHILENLKAKRSIEEKHNANQSDDISTLWQDINDRIKIGFAP
jgi:hypothetical protein